MKAGLLAALYCCTMAAAAPAALTPASGSPASGAPPMVRIPGGTFAMGSAGAQAEPFEGPVHQVSVKPFWMDRTEVTVAQFAQFVQATSHRTEAERFGWSATFDSARGHWRRMDGANWRHPNGPRSEARPGDPVTHVSWFDAHAYARWRGHRLPTEAEWEFAARGGLAGKTYSWGDELTPGGRAMANWWQGDFPVRDQGLDGYRGAAPVASFPPNGYGLHDMTGNVWEWVADWFGADYYAHSPATDPTGPARGSQRVTRGGSYLCAANFCANYRVSGRSSATPDSSTAHIGFRTVRSD